VERDLAKVREFCFKKKDDGLRHEEPMQTPIQETEWERNLAFENAEAKEKMAMELRRMGFGSDAVARILHLDEIGLETKKGKRIADVGDRRNE
jgi:hypothetical protein